MGGNTGDKPVNHLKHLASGGITGAIEACITYPTEFVKTKMQLYPKYAKMGVIGAFKDTVKLDGVKGLYRGLSVLVTLSAPKTGIRFYSKSFYDSQLQKFMEGGRLTTVLAGLGAGVTEAILVVTPAETIKTKLVHDLISHGGKYNGLIHGSRVIVAEQGFSGIYKGLGPTILKQGTNQATRFFVYGECRKLFDPILPEGISLFLSGGFAGAASVYVNTPIDVVKTNMQGLKAHKYNGALDCFTTILKNEGVRGLYKGTVPRLTRVVLDVALTFTMFEYIKRGLDFVFPEDK